MFLSLNAVEMGTRVPEFIFLMTFIHTPGPWVTLESQWPFKKGSRSVRFFLTARTQIFFAFAANGFSGEFQHPKNCLHVHITFGVIQYTRDVHARVGCKQVFFFVIFSLLEKRNRLYRFLRRAGKREAQITLEKISNGKFVGVCVRTHAHISY